MILAQASQPVVDGAFEWVSMLLPSFTVLLGILAAWLRRKGGQHAQAVRVMTDALEISTYDTKGIKVEAVREVKRLIAKAATRSRPLQALIGKAASLSQKSAEDSSEGSYKLGMRSEMEQRVSK